MKVVYNSKNRLAKTLASLKKPFSVSEAESEVESDSEIEVESDSDGYESVSTPVISPVAPVEPDAKSEENTIQKRLNKHYQLEGEQDKLPDIKTIPDPRPRSYTERYAALEKEFGKLNFGALTTASVAEISKLQSEALSVHVNAGRLLDDVKKYKAETGIDIKIEEITALKDQADIINQMALNTLANTQTLLSSVPISHEEQKVADQKASPTFTKPADVIQEDQNDAQENGEPHMNSSRPLELDLSADKDDALTDASSIASTDSNKSPSESSESDEEIKYQSDSEEKQPAAFQFNAQLRDAQNQILALKAQLADAKQQAEQAQMHAQDLTTQFDKTKQEYIAQMHELDSMLANSEPSASDSQEMIQRQRGVPLYHHQIHLQAQHHRAQHLLNLRAQLFL